MTIYLDLDGTILDVSARYYQLHTELLREYEVNPLGRIEYWNAKRTARSEYELGIGRGLTPDVARAYADAWTSHIEDVTRLRLDQPLSGAIAALTKLQSVDQLVLVTLRQHRDRLVEQLRWWGIYELIETVLSADPRAAPRDVKADLIRGDPLFARKDSLIIGDSEIDLLAGRVLGIPAYAVLTGIRTRELLQAHEPTWIGDSLEHVVKTIASRYRSQPSPGSKDRNEYQVSRSSEAVPTAQA